MTSKKGLTYEDFKKMFSKEDLDEWNKLCLAFVKLRADKNNIQLWHELVESNIPSELGQILNQIHNLRRKYDLYPELGEVFFNVWRAGFGKYGSSVYEQVSW